MVGLVAVHLCPLRRIEDFFFVSKRVIIYHLPFSLLDTDNAATTALVATCGKQAVWEGHSSYSNYAPLFYTERWVGRMWKKNENDPINNRIIHVLVHTHTHLFFRGFCFEDDCFCAI